MKQMKWFPPTGLRTWRRSWGAEVCLSSSREDMTKYWRLSDTNEDADHIYMMFSATFPKEARVVAKEYMSTDHIRIRVGRIGSVHVNVTQNVRDSRTNFILYWREHRLSSQRNPKNVTVSTIFCCRCLLLARLSSSITKKQPIFWMISFLIKAYRVLLSTRTVLSARERMRCKALLQIPCIAVTDSS